MAQAAFKLRLPEELRKALDEAAARDGLSLNAEIVTRLHRSLDSPEHKIDPDELREDIARAAISVMKLVRDTHESDTPEMKSLSLELMGIFVELGAILAFSFSSSDKRWQLIQENLRYGREAGKARVDIFERAIGTAEAPKDLAERILERGRRFREEEREE